jgi:hypothetical protein
MKNKNIRNKWKQFIEDQTYSKYFLSNIEEWNIKLEDVKKYIDENKKRPLQSSKNINIRFLGNWINVQQINYTKKYNIMKDINIRNKWDKFINDEKYKRFFKSNEEWLDKLEEVKKYIDDNKKKPSFIDKNNIIKLLGIWILRQQQNYMKKQCIMKDENIRNKWMQFIEDPIYNKYFLSNEQEWLIKLENVKKYIDDNKKRPSNNNKNKYTRQLGSWISNQQKNYIKKQYIMKNENMRNKWKQFIEDPKYSNNNFILNEEEWNIKLEKVKQYIDENKKRPSSIDKNNIIKSLGIWILHQQQNYTKK